MAQLVIAAAGAAIGGATLGTGIVAFGMTGTAIGWAAGSMLGSMLQKGPNQQGPRLNDLRVTGTEYGQAHPWVAGSPRLPGQIVWASTKREIANTQKVGKGGGGSRVTTYTYEVDLLYRLTENEIIGVSRLWSNGELVYNGATTKSGVWNEVRIYTGASDQMPDPTYEAAVGAGNAPAYRGGGTVLIRGLQLGQGGNIPNLTFEVGTPALDPNALKESYVICAITTRRDTSVFDKYNIANTELPTWDSYFSEFGNSAVIHYSAYTNGTAPGDSGVLETKTVPINTAHDYYFYAGNAFWSNDIADSTIEFLDSGGNTVFVMQTLDDVAPDFMHDLRIGSSIGTLSKVSNNAHTDGIIEFIGGSVVFTRTNSLSNNSFTFSCDALSIISARISGVRVRSTYQGIEANPSAGVFFHKIPFDESELNTGSSFYNVDGASRALLIRCGYSESDFDVSSISDADKPLRAFAIGQVGSTRSSLEVLQKAWYFEVSKSDKIYLLPRSVTPLVTIPWDDLGTAEDIDSNQEPLALQIGSDIELPAQIALSYNNVASDYNIATENSDRLITNQLSTATVQLPLGMLPDEAKGVANALLFDQLASLTTTTIRVPLKYAYLEPGDVFEAINFDGRTYRLRIQSKRDTLSIIELECVLDDVGALQSASITDNSYISITDPVRVAPTLFEPLDIPILRDADDDAGYYAAVAAERDSADDEWAGAAYVQAFSPGAFQQEFTTGDACVMGECLTTLGSWTGGNVFDESNTIDVEVVGELESSTRDLMLADLSVNAMLIGSEAIRFRLANLLSADGERRTYRLSGLLRGQRGTEWAIGGHVADERVVLLNNAIRRVPGLLTQIGLERDVKAVTLNLLLSDVPYLAFTNEAVGLKPFSPANVVALADGADLRITWQRRTRLAVKYGGAVDQVVPLGEVSEQYRVEIYDGSTLVRTATVTSPSYTYAAADIASDGFSPGDPITVSVSQLSAIVGAGYNTETTGTAP